MVCRTTSTMILLGSTLLVAGAFSHPMMPISSRSRSNSCNHSIPKYSHSHPARQFTSSLCSLATLRGGEQQEDKHRPPPAVETDEETVARAQEQVPKEEPPLLKVTKESSGFKESLLTSAVALPMGALTKFGTTYASCLEQRPILTKSATAGCIFALSDFLAQRLENTDDASKKRRINKTRILASAAVGFFYFGPAAHYWYENIFKLLPGTSLVSTLQKAALGQMFFGPTFTCIFFATGLMQSGTFSLGNWLRKIKSDLPGAWLAGAGFWPLVDLVSYSVIQPKYIPLFVNICSLIWTTYLVLKSYS